MANRDLTNFRSVINQVADQSSGIGEIMQAGAELTEGILRQGQEAKITENLSQAQLELSALNNQYRIDYEGDPLKGMEKYKQDRQAVFDKYNEGISPLYRMQWKDNARKLSTRDDAVQQGWAIKQTRTNTVNSINRTMENNFKQAGADGRAFAQDDSAEVSSFLNFEASKENLANFGDKNLGSETTSQVLRTYDEDYMKSFIAGVSDENPLKALKLMESDEIKNSFDDVNQYNDIKKNIENRALNFQKVAIEREALSALTKNNDIINKSMQEPLSQADILKLSSGASKPTKDYLMRLGGFKTGGGQGKLSNFDKAAEKAKIQEAVLNYGATPDIGASSLGKIQNDLITALNNKSITRNDWTFYTNQLMQPYANQVEENLSQFQFKSGGFLGFGGQETGFPQVQKDLDQFLVLDEDGLEDGVSEDDFFHNNQQRIKMYSQYERALRRSAEKRNMQPENILSLPEADRNVVLTEAANDAKKNYLMDRFPSTQGMADNFPDKIIGNNGQSMSTGLGSGNPVANVSNPITEKDLDNMSIEELQRFVDGQ